MGRAALTDMEVCRSIYVGKIEHVRRHVSDPLPVLLVSGFLNLVQKRLNAPLATFGRHTDTLAPC